MKSTRHTVYHIAYHLVWVTKDRRTVLNRQVLRIRMNKGHLWHSSAYIGTAGNVSAATIQRYI
ncbi:MAG: hypothetical protein HY314_14400 [Acidobacteria bacterium]|nr:hypothetical protein [Acidobacteriota bacterium]